MSNMAKKKITLCICGAVGATNVGNYLIALQQNYELNVVLTKNALNFITIHSIKNYCNKLYDEIYDIGEHVNHVFLGQHCDYFLIIPATANIIGKIANGIADDLVSSAALNVKQKIIFCPNMNSNMWRNTIVQRNVRFLKEIGHIFLNKTRLSYEVCNKTFVESDCALPTIKELLEFLDECESNSDM